MGRQTITAAAVAALFRPNGPGACYPRPSPRNSPATRLLCPASHTRPHTSQNSEVLNRGFPEPADPAVVYLENQAGSLYLEEEAEIDRYERMFSHLIAKALDPEESRRMIARVARDLTDVPT